MPNCDRRWMPNHDRFECQTAIDSDAILQITIMGLKPGPKPIAKSTGKPDRRRRDNKDTPSNTPGLKPSKSTGK